MSRLADSDLTHDIGVNSWIGQCVGHRNHKVGLYLLWEESIM